MSLRPPVAIVESFGVNGDHNLIPVPSQISVTPGAASFNDGFPPLTRTALTAGGIPPAGLDMNGILYMVSAYCAWLQGGGQFSYDNDFVANNTGYTVGAILQSTIDRQLFFFNTVDNNANNPDIDTTDWIAYKPLSNPTNQQQENSPAGATNNLLMGPHIGFLDINPLFGNANITGITAGNDGQIVIVTNIHATNSVTLNALNTGSASANRFRLPADITLLQYSGVTLRYSTQIGYWVPM